MDRLLTSSHLHQRLALLYTAAFCGSPEETFLEAVLVIEQRNGEEGCSEGFASSYMWTQIWRRIQGTSRRSPGGEYKTRRTSLQPMTHRSSCDRTSEVTFASIMANQDDDTGCESVERAWIRSCCCAAKFVPFRLKPPETVILKIATRRRDCQMYTISTRG